MTRKIDSEYPCWIAFCAIWVAKCLGLKIIILSINYFYFIRLLFGSSVGFEMICRGSLVICTRLKQSPQVVTGQYISCPWYTRIIKRFDDARLIRGGATNVGKLQPEWRWWDIIKVNLDRWNWYVKRQNYKCNNIYGKNVFEQMFERCKNCAQLFVVAVTPDLL